MHAIILIYAKKLLKLKNINRNIWLENSGNTPIIVSLYLNYYEIAKLLIHHPKTNINIKNKKGLDAAAIACYNNQIEIIKKLANKGILYAILQYRILLENGRGVA